MRVNDIVNSYRTILMQERQVYLVCMWLFSDAPPAALSNIFSRHHKFRHFIPFKQLTHTQLAIVITKKPAVVLRLRACLCLPLCKKLKPIFSRKIIICHLPPLSSAHKSALFGGWSPAAPLFWLRKPEINKIINCHWSQPKWRVF